MSTHSIPTKFDAWFWLLLVACLAAFIVTIFVSYMVVQLCFKRSKEEAEIKNILSSKACKGDLDLVVIDDCPARNDHTVDFASEYSCCEHDGVGDHGGTSDTKERCDDPSEVIIDIDEGSTSNVDCTTADDAPSSSSNFDAMAGLRIVRAICKYYARKLLTASISSECLQQLFNIKPLEEKENQLFGGFKCIKQLYKGCVTEVWKVADALGNEKAFKFLFFDDFEDFENVCAEISIHAECLEYGGVIPLKGFYTRKNYFVMVMDLAKGTLFSLVNRPMREYHVYKMAKAVATFLKQAHDNDIMHGDIKTSNILIKKNSNGEPEFFLSDFGLSHRLNGQMAYDFLGTFGYMAPEYFTGLGYGSQADMYAFGIVLYYCLFGCLSDGLESLRVLEQHYKKRIEFQPQGMENAWYALMLKESLKQVRAHCTASNLQRNWKVIINGLLDPNQYNRHTADDVLLLLDGIYLP